MSLLSDMEAKFNDVQIREYRTPKVIDELPGVKGFQTIVIVTIAGGDNLFLHLVVKVIFADS